MFPARAIQCLRAAGLVVLAAAMLCGCATPALDVARNEFYAGRVNQADQTLDVATASPNDRVLFLMERGMIRQEAGRYADSSADFIEAAELIDELRTYSVSKGAASLVVNDGVQDFRGTPFERTLIHCFTAVNHLALAHWDDAAVEARRIIKSLDPSMKGDYPEDAFSRYMAGFCLEMIDDDSNAALQYRKATDLLTDLVISPDTGRIEPGGSDVTEGPWPHELVCFVFMGRTLRGYEGGFDGLGGEPAAYAEIVHNGTVLGRSYNLADTVELAYTTAQMEAARKVAKTVGRVVLKEAIAESVTATTDDKFLGELTRFLLIGLLERPDLRRWETLPRWLQVARVPCPPDLTEFDVVFRNSSGGRVYQRHVTEPMEKNGNVYVSFCRDLRQP